MILITDTFKKLLEKISSISIDDVINEIEKNKAGLNNFKKIWKINWKLILKWYLLSKKVRLVVYFKEQSWNYMPLYIAKKESKEWYNISSKTISSLDSIINKSFDDLVEWKYNII